MTESARILVVDDEEPVCKTVANALRTDKHTVDTALSAEDALLRAEAFRYDVVITDLMMPGLSGMDLLKIASERMPETKVIMITGFPSVKSAVEAMRLGAFDFIPKPFTLEELKVIIDRAIEQHYLFSQLGIFRGLTLALIISVPVWLVLGILMGLIWK